MKKQKKDRVKTNNQFNVGFAFPGICSLCFTEICEFNGSHPNGTPIITKLKPNFRELLVNLNDASRMRVSLCKDCFESFGPEDVQELMEHEINGWKHEVDREPWDEQKKKSYMDNMVIKRISNCEVKNWGSESLKKIKEPRPENIEYKFVEHKFKE